MRKQRVGINARMGFEGFVTIEAVRPDGTVAHRQHMHNVLTDEGLEALKANQLGNEMLDGCFLGRSVVPEAVTDTMDDWISFWLAACGGSLSQAYCTPGVQERTIVAVSTDPGTNDDVYTYHPGAAPYWSLTRKRIFYNTDDYFKLGTLPPAADNPGGVCQDWYTEGWAVREIESSYIGEVGFGGGGDQIGGPMPGIFVSNQCSGDVLAPLWYTYGAALWNRVVLPQTIGYMLAPDQTNVWYPWEDMVADVLFDHDYVIVVTLEVRMYPDTSEVVDVVDINGVSTTCTTRVIDIDRTTQWGSGGALDAFGRWRADYLSAKVSETASLPATLEDSFDQTGAETADDATKQATPETNQQVMTYNFGSGKGNFGSGIGALLHGNFASGALAASYCFATVFDPPIAKTDEQRLEFNVRYSWGRV